MYDDTIAEKMVSYKSIEGAIGVLICNTPLEA